MTCALVIANKDSIIVHNGMATLWTREASSLMRVAEMNPSTSDSARPMAHKHHVGPIRPWIQAQYKRVSGVLSIGVCNKL